TRPELDDDKWGTKQHRNFCNDLNQQIDHGLDNSASAQFTGSTGLSGLKAYSRLKLSNQSMPVSSNGLEFGYPK
ncbi:hypothetical protein A2U01_0019745, partial [Trifolium medium]|nr:hypothetical protein [Trifolium medium]